MKGNLERPHQISLKGKTFQSYYRLKPDIYSDKQKLILKENIMTDLTTTSTNRLNPLLFGVGAVTATIAILFGSASSAPAEPDPATAVAKARGKVVDGVCYSQPTSKTSTVQAQRFLKTEPITITVKANLDGNCNLTYSVQAPPTTSKNNGEVKSWGVIYTDSYPNGLSGEPIPNSMNPNSSTGTGTLSTRNIVGLGADHDLGLRVFVEYGGTATEGREYYTYFAEVPLY